ARTVAPSETMRNVRWGGPALYTSVSERGVLNESLFYSREIKNVEINNLSFKLRSKADPGSVLVERVFYKYRLLRPVEALVYSPKDEKFQGFLSRIDSDPGVKAAKKDAQCFWSLGDRAWVGAGPPIRDDDASLYEEYDR